MVGTAISDSAAGTAQRSSQDMRGAERFALLIGGAKLIGETAEFLCVIRDVSETGLRIKLFHPLPAETRLAIELANGDFYFIERVWETEGEAGFRFAAPIDVAQFIAEDSLFPRRPLRLRLSVPALLTADKGATVVRLHDLSQHGACIEAARHLAIGQQIKLEPEGLPDLIANVCWRSLPEYGVVFKNSFAFDELARFAAAIQTAPQRPLEPGARVTR